MSDPEVAIFVLLGLVAGGHKNKVLGPAKGKVIGSKFRIVAEMGIPASVSTDIEDGIAVILNDLAAVTHAEGEGVAGARRAGKKNTEGIITAGTQFSLGEPLILEESEGLAGGEGDGVDLESARKLDEKNALATGKGAELDRGVALDGVIGMNGGTDLVKQCVERKKGRGKARERVGGPDVVVKDFVSEARLSKHEIFVTHGVHKNIEGAGENPVDGSMEEMALRGRVSFNENTEGVDGIKALNVRKPECGETGVGGGSKGGVIELRQEILGGVVGETSVNGDKFLVENRSAKEARQLLFFDGVARNGQAMTDARKNKPRDAALEGLKEGDLAAFQSENEVATTKLNMIGSGNRVYALGIQTQGVEGGEGFSGRRIGGNCGTAEE